MNKTGSPDPDSTPQRSRPGVGIIVGAGILVVLGAMVGVQMLGVLHGVLFPPAPPILGSFSVSDHTSPSYGVDDWLYISSDDACRIVRFYESAGAECRVAPGVCSDGFAQAENPREGFNVARCTGEISWSIFQQRYYVNVASGYEAPSLSRVRLEREIFWTGVLPAARSD